MDDGARIARRRFLRGSAALGVASLAAPYAQAGNDPALADLIEDLVTANRILAEEEIVDAFGHISRRHPSRPDRFLMSQARAPSVVEAEDIMEFDLSGAPVEAAGRTPYAERFIHAAIYAARQDVNSVIHNHSPGLVSFSASTEPLKPMSHMGAPLGQVVPVWEIREKFGEGTNLLVAGLDTGGDLARKLGAGPAVLMRGHGAVVVGGSIRRATYLAIFLEAQAKLLKETRELGGVTYLSPGEIAALTPPPRATTTAGIDGVGRAWEHWCKKAGRPFRPRGY